MRTSLVTRFLAASITIAVVAIVATAWLASRTTTDRLVGEFDRSLEADGSIYSQLIDHAATHQDWDAIGPLVDELARRTGRRIALTTQEGHVLADSHADPASPDNALALPEPAALIDPLTPLLTIHGAETGGVLGGLPPAMAIPEGSLGPVLATEVGPDGCVVDGDVWQRLDFAGLAARWSEGYIVSGVTGWFTPSPPDGVRDVDDDEAAPPSDELDFEADDPPRSVRTGCSCSWTTATSEGSRSATPPSPPYTHNSPTRSWAASTMKASLTSRSWPDGPSTAMRMRHLPPTCGSSRSPKTSMPPRSPTAAPRRPTGGCWPITSPLLRSSTLARATPRARSRLRARTGC